MKTKTIILSIHPQHIDKIFSGEKLYEYRKRIPTDIQCFIIYATAPIKKIVAIVEVDSVLKETPKSLWELTKKHSGVSYDFFMNYFDKAPDAYAIKFRHIYKLPNHMDITVLDGIKRAPQSYAYVNITFYDLCKKLNLQDTIHNFV